MSDRLLIVESNGVFAEQIKALLTNAGYSVEVVHSALDAYKTATNSPVDLIVTNLQLPKVSGLHLAKKLKAKPISKNIPIMFLSKKSLLNANVKDRVKQFGKALLTLPLNKAKLLTLIEKILASTKSAAREEGSGDYSQVDTDKFDKRELQKQLDIKTSSSASIVTRVQSDTEPHVQNYEASKALAEITQEAEDNLTNILATEKTDPLIEAPAESNYLGWWGFRIRPFSNTPDSRFYFNSKQHSEAITRLMYAVDNMEGLAVLVGKIGAGKTTLARRMLENFDSDEYIVTLLVIIHSAITPDWLLRKIAMQLGVKKTETQKLLLIGQLYQRLVEIYEEGKKAVVLIDEAQMLQTRELMEEFRGLLNLEVPGKKLLTFVFFGLEELNEYLALDEPLKQRIALKYNLHSFDRPSTRAYILHRLSVGGIDNPVFSEDAINLVYDFSNGTPRLINTICNNALLEGFFLKKRYIDQNLVRQVGENLDLTMD